MTQPTTTTATIAWDIASGNETFVNALKNGTKLTDENVDAQLFEFAASFLKASSMVAKNPFLSSVATNAKRAGRLSRAQARGVLNVVLASLRQPAQTTNYADIHAAVKALAGVCDGARSLDGAGYNGVDAAFGHSLAGRDSLSPRMAQAAYKMLRKYSGQLAGFGIVYSEIVNPTTGVAGTTARPSMADRDVNDDACTDGDGSATDGADRLPVEAYS